MSLAAAAAWPRPDFDHKVNFNDGSSRQKQLKGQPPCLSTVVHGIFRGEGSTEKDIFRDGCWIFK